MFSAHEGENVLPPSRKRRKKKSLQEILHNLHMRHKTIPIAAPIGMASEGMPPAVWKEYEGRENEPLRKEQDYAHALKVLENALPWSGGDFSNKVLQHHDKDGVTSAFRRLYAIALYVMDNMLPELNLTKNIPIPIHRTSCQVDYLSTALLSGCKEAPEKHVAADVYGDGNCLFRALSVGLDGQEDRHIEFRLRIAIHAIVFYHEVLSLKEKGYASLTLMDVDLDDAIVRAVCLGRWTNCLHVAIAAQVFECKINLLCPPLGGEDDPTRQ